MERLTVFDGAFWEHKNFPPVAEDTVDEFIDCVKELAERLAAIENILGIHMTLITSKKWWRPSTITGYCLSQRKG